jgi:hypothetical protein
MAIVKASEDSEAGRMPSEERIRAQAEQNQ